MTTVGESIEKAVQEYKDASPQMKGILEAMWMLEDFKAEEINKAIANLKGK
jgi:hypothetical protein